MSRFDQFVDCLVYCLLYFRVSCQFDDFLMKSRWVDFFVCRFRTGYLCRVDRLEDNSQNMVKYFSSRSGFEVLDSLVEILLGRVQLASCV